MITETCPQIMSSDHSIQVTNYRNPAIEGTIVTFSCPNELILTGSNTSMCMRNGEWEPDPKRNRCESESSIFKLLNDYHNPIVSCNYINASLNYGIKYCIDLLQQINCGILAY